MADGARPPAMVRNIERTRRRIANQVRHRQEQIARIRAQLGPTVQGARLDYRLDQIRRLEAEIAGLAIRLARVSDCLNQLPEGGAE